LLAVANNSGKSNILRFLNGPFLALFQGLRSGGAVDAGLAPLHVHRPGAPDTTFALAMIVGGDLHEQMSEGLACNQEAADAFESVVKDLAEEGLVWFPFAVVTTPQQQRTVGG
jgi:hypothetical protein